MVRAHRARGAAGGGEEREGEPDLQREQEVGSCRTWRGFGSHVGDGEPVQNFEQRTGVLK